MDLTNLPAIEPGYTLTNSFTNELSFDQLYEVDTRLRSGSFGTVFTCHHRFYLDVTFAVKILERTKLLKRDDDAVFREVQILKELIGVPHIIQLIDFFVESGKLYVVQSYMAGGDVFDRLAQRTNYSEKDARDLAKILLETIHALHHAKPNPIVHRDLKPENLLLRDKVDDTSIMLADFGFARHVTEDGCRTRCGTPAFVAPEVIIGVPYRTSVDLWSIGCLVYMLIGGYPPFQGENHRDLFRKVRASDFVFHETYWKHVSVSAKQLISGLLTVNQEKRWSSSKALECDWFKKTSADQLLSTDLSGSITELKKFTPRKAWKSANLALRWAMTAKFWDRDKMSFSQQLSNWDKESIQKSMEEDNTTLSTRSAPEPTTTSAITAKIPTIKFADVYQLVNKLRKGSYATVWECVHKHTNDRFAVKIIKREGLQPKDDEAILNEVAILQSLSGNKYVIQLMDFYEENDYFYIITELCEAGDVFDKIVEKTHYTEKDARDLVVILLKAVASLHRVGIAHRDIKPQNLLLQKKTDDSTIKLADFGFARRVHTPESLTTRVGTPTYVAPEILKNIPHDERVDLWSIGVVTFVLLVGYPPFLEEEQTELFRKIRHGEWKFHPADWKYISEDAKELVKGLLIVDPKERWSIDEALRCPWVMQSDKQLSSVSLSDTSESIRLKRNRLRSTAKAFLLLGKGSTIKQFDVATQAQDIASEVLERIRDALT